MTTKLIQEQFGARIIEAFTDFARQDLPDVATLESDHFNHISNHKIRHELSQVLYGARWLYKLGLALLVTQEERAAHVRAQIIDYASVSEGILSYCISHAIKNKYTVGDGYKYDDPDLMKKTLKWNNVNPDHLLSKRNFWWLIKIAGQFGIITLTIENELQWLREQRNTVHIGARLALGSTAYLYQSKRAFEATINTLNQTKIWKGNCP